MRHRSTYAALVAALCVSAAAAQQNLVQAQGRKIFFSGPSNNTAEGDLAPGLAGERFGGGGQDNLVMDGQGNVFFRARLVSNGGAALAPIYLQYAYYYGSSAGDLQLVARGGDPEPSGTLPNVIMTTSTSGAPFTGSPRIAENGLILFSSSLWDFVGNSLTSANDSAYFIGYPGAFQMLAREGDFAPGCGGATFSSSFASMSQQPTALNSAGDVLFKSSLAGATAVPPVVTANNEAWFTGQAGSLQLMLRKGDSYPFIGDGGTISALGFISQMNQFGWVVNDVTLAQGTGAPAVTAANDRALLLYQPGVGLTQLMREGDPTPIPGTTYNVASNSWFFNSGASTFNVLGEIVLNCELAGAVTAGVNDRAVIKVGPTGQSVVMRRGDAAPGVAGALWDLANNSSLFHNDSGQIAFQASMTGAVTTADDTGIWVGTPGNWTLVVREGDVAPGTGSTFGNTTGLSMLMNGAGQVFFSNTLANNNGSAWMWDPVLGLQRIFAAGDQIEVYPGTFRTPYTAGTIQFTNNDGRPLGFANDGTIALKLSMNDGLSYGSQLATKVRIGSLTGYPAILSQGTGGLYDLHLNAGATEAGNTYVVAGSITGTAPGLPIGPFVLPLNFDFYTQFTLDYANVAPFINTFSTLDADGRRLAQIAVPPLPGLAGLYFYHAYGVIDQTAQLSFVSEPASLLIGP